jgi:glycosyltransferase involved in cell wall biosynthesis
MKIVFTSNGILTPYAGMNNRAVSLANHIVKCNEEVLFFVFLNRRDDIDPKIKVVEYAPFRIGSVSFFRATEGFSPSKYVFSKLVSRQFHKIDPDVVCVDHPPMDWYATRARRNARFRLVYTYHSDVDPNLYSGQMREIMEKYRRHSHNVARDADLTCAVSKFVKQQLDENGINSTVVYNGVDTELFRPRIFNYVTYKTGTPIILYVGRLLRFKGVDLLIKSFKQVKKEIADARLYIVGSTHGKDDIDYWCEIERLSKGFENSIFFLGNVCDEVLSLLYSVSDLFVCASLYEGFGMPFLEAQSCGVPCVGFDTSAIPEVVINGRTGVLVEKGNLEKLTESAIHLLKDNESRRKMGARARKYAEKFDWNVISTQFHKKLREL